jgi:Arc/MetJ-type ribon-helix-helix transcriptional regulator
MQPTTLRLPDELVAQIEDRADEQGYSSRSEYIRVVLREHVEDETGEGDDRDQASAIADLTERVTDLEERLDRREASHEPKSYHRDPSTQKRSESVTADTDDREEQVAPASDDASATAEADAETAPAEDIDEVLTGWRPGRNQEKREQQHAAGRAVLEWLRDQEVASASEFKAHVETEAPVTGQSPPTWWKKTAREALKRAQDAGLVEFVDGRKEWKWRG